MEHGAVSGWRIEVEWDAQGSARRVPGEATSTRVVGAVRVIPTVGVTPNAGVTPSDSVTPSDREWSIGRELSGDIAVETDGARVLVRAEESRGAPWYLARNRDAAEACFAAFMRAADPAIAASQPAVLTVEQVEAKLAAFRAGELDAQRPGPAAASDHLRALQHALRAADASALDDGSWWAALCGALERA